jgi:hypothetical protein
MRRTGRRQKGKEGRTESLVKQTKLAGLGFLVTGVAEDTSVQEGSVNIGNYTSQETSATSQLELQETEEREGKGKEDKPMDPMYLAE